MPPDDQAMATVRVRLRVTVTVTVRARVRARARVSARPAGLPAPRDEALPPEGDLRGGHLVRGRGNVRGTWLGVEVGVGVRLVVFAIRTLTLFLTPSLTLSLTLTCFCRRFLWLISHCDAFSLKPAWSSG